MAKLEVILLLVAALVCATSGGVTKRCAGNRVKRAPPTNYFMNVLVIADIELQRNNRRAYSHQTKLLQQMYELIIIGLNKRARSMYRGGVSVTVSGAGFYNPSTEATNVPLPRDAIVIGVNKRKICKFSYTKQFNTWLKSSAYTSRFGRKQIHHVILLTGFDLLDADGSSRLRGHTNAGKQGNICTADFGSVLEMTYNLEMIQTAAYLIGRSLGATMETNAKKCTDGLVMSPRVSVRPLIPSHWRYSSCAAKSIKGVLAKLSTCLSKSKVYPDLKVTKRFTPTEQCKFAYKSSLVQVKHVELGSSDICQQGYECRYVASEKRFINALDGTTCAKNRQCSHGVCIGGPYTGESTVGQQEACINV